MQLVYLEGLRTEFYDENSEEKEEDLSEDWGSLSQFGINVKQVEA